jgi:sporulation protein YunB
MFATARKTLGGVLVLLAVAAGITVLLLFRSMVTELAMSSAKEAVVMNLNTIVRDLMTDMTLRGDSLVILERDDQGRITAVSTDVAAVNTLSAAIMEQTMTQAGEKVIRLQIPLGSLLGNALFLNRGPKIPVEVSMLSSSVAGFRSELTSAGINQTRHQIRLDISVQISLLMPWRTIGSSVETEVLVAETVIVGQVPDSYMNWGDTTWQNQ